MPTIVAVFGILIAAAGVWAYVSPERFHQSAAQWLLPASRRAGAIPRMILAATLWVAADVSRIPIVFVVLALGFFFAGLAVLVPGTAGLRSRIEGLTRHPAKLARELTREWAVAIVVFGWFLIWAVVPSLPNS